MRSEDVNVQDLMDTYVRQMIKGEDREMTIETEVTEDNIKATAVVTINGVEEYRGINTKEALNVYNSL